VLGFAPGRPFSWASFVVVAFLAVASPSSAQREAAVVVVRTADGDLRDEYGLALDARLRREERSRFAVPNAADVPSYEADLRSAIAAYHDLHPDVAALALDAIVLSFERTGEGLSRSSLLETFAYRALVAHARGLEAESVASIDRALAIDPSYAPDPARFPPAFRRNIDARRSLVRVASLRVVVAPSDATVVVDAADARASGESLRVGVGRHVLRIAAPHHRPYIEVVEVPEGTLERIVALTNDAFARLRDAGQAGDPVAPLVQAAEAIGADLIVVDLMRESGAIRVVLVDTFAELRAELLVDPAENATSVLERLYEPPRVEVSTVPEAELPPRTVPPDRRRRRVIAVAAGAAAALGLALGLSFGLRGRDRFVGTFESDVP